MSKYYKRGNDPRPCENGMSCIHEFWDASENGYYCDIDDEGNECPYIKPYGRQKYQKDHCREAKEGETENVKYAT